MITVWFLSYCWTRLFSSLCVVECVRLTVSSCAQAPWTVWFYFELCTMYVGDYLWGLCWRVNLFQCSWCTFFFLLVVTLRLLTSLIFALNQLVLIICSCLPVREAIRWPDVVLQVSIAFLWERKCYIITYSWTNCGWLKTREGRKPLWCLKWHLPKL